MKIKNYIVGGVVVLLLGLGFFCGYKTYPKIKPCPTITTDTITVVDSSWHTIEDSLELTINNLKKEVKYWKQHRDTIKLPGDSVLIPADVDTAAILKDYYSVYKYGWAAENDSIAIKDSVTITQNVPVKHKIDYKFKMPFTTVVNNIDNSISYARYIQFGIDLPVYNYSVDSINKVNFNNISLDGTYVFPKGYVGVRWQPNTETISARLGTTIAKFKTKR